MRNSPLVSGTYVGVAVVWFALSYILGNALNAGASRSDVFSLSGWAFVVVSALGLYVFVRHTQAEFDRRVDVLREWDHTLRSILDQSLVAWVLIDDAGTFVDANGIAYQLLGVSPPELLGRSFFRFLGPSFQSALQHWQASLQSGETSQGTVISAQETGLDIEYRFIPAIRPGLHLGVFRDVSTKVIG